MSEIIKLITDYGFVFVFVSIFIYFIFKYGEKFLNISLTRMENKNYMIDALTKSLDNCTNVIKHNTKAMDNNSSVIKSYTDNAHKLEKKIDELILTNKERENTTNTILTDIKILKDRK